MPKDMRDCRSLWQRLGGMFKGYHPLPWYWCVVVIACLSVGNARAEEGHTHEGRVGKFYSTWTMPDAPQISCCHGIDCSPAASKFENGKWYAQRDGTWYPVPEHKIERERDSPDGRSHMCGRIGYSGQFTVYCFVRGNGA